VADIRKITRGKLGVVIPAAGLAVGVFVGTLQSTEWRWRSPLLAEVVAIGSLDPVRALPRTGTMLAVLEAQRHLESGRPYAAWEALHGFIDVEGPTGSLANLLAAKAAYEWGGWDRVRTVLAGRPWLRSEANGEGLYYLARAEEELGNLNGAETAYRSYLAVTKEANTGVARARHANVLSKMGLSVEAAEAYRLAAAEYPEISDWLTVSQLEQLASAGQPLPVTGPLAQGSASASVRMRRTLVVVADLVTGAETDRAIERLDWEARILNAEGARAEAAELHLERARLLLASSTAAAARDLLRTVAADVGVPPAMRVRAAQALGGLTDLGANEEFARAAAYQSAAQPGPAARTLRAALDAGSPDGGDVRLRLAQLLYDERDFTPARAAFLHAGELLTDQESKAYAELHAARSLFRSGGGARARQTAIAEFAQVAERYAGTAAAGTALFLLGDEAASTQSALGFYRRAAAVTHSPDAREALYRVGDRNLRLKNNAAAIQAWEEYVARYPAGDQTALVAYEIGKLHDAAGRRTEARAMYTASSLAEPTAYWGIRAAERLGVEPLQGVFASPRAWVGLASEPVEATAVLQRLDHLAAAGLTGPREQEYQAALRDFARKPLAMLTLAEGIRDRNDAVEAIRLGRLLLVSRGGVWDDRVLRLVYPFPYRDLIVAESERAGINPLFYAALIRQESTFRPAVKSWVGATGLGQIMPATGQWLAPSVGIRDYDHSLLEIPEVNLRMGTKYLRDLLRRYNGAPDLALAGYNAGPGRADRWRTQFKHGRDTDAFRAAIPFDETRSYVMIVMRNAAIYERLYSDGPSRASLLGD